MRSFSTFFLNDFPRLFRFSYHHIKGKWLVVILLIFHFLRFSAGNRGWSRTYIGVPRDFEMQTPW